MSLVRQATASFVHARDVHVPVADVAGDLDVADEGWRWSAVARWLQVAPLSVEKRTWRAPPPTAKLFQETYIRPKKGEDGLLSAQPDSRSSLPPL